MVLALILAPASLRAAQARTVQGHGYGTETPATTAELTQFLASGRPVDLVLLDEMASWNDGAGFSNFSGDILERLREDGTIVSTETDQAAADRIAFEFVEMLGGATQKRFHFLRLPSGRIDDLAKLLEDGWPPATLVNGRFVRHS